MHELLSGKPGDKRLLLGNEAIARGAIEGGLAFATAYPGTPSSEVALNFFQIKQETDLYFEYSTNEKVALEVAAGAAVSGLRTMVTMKHVGMNVAADPLMTLAYTGVNGGMVILTADDPSLFSSQNEQDNRYYARLSGLPMLEPTTPQEAKEMTLAAFDLSEKLKVPVLLRTTTRINHSRGVVTLGKIRPRKTQGNFKKDPFSYVTVPAVSRNLHVKLLQVYDQAMALANQSSFNEIIGQGKWGIVTQGVGFCYVQDALDDLKTKESFSVLKLGFSYPFPAETVKKFLSQVDKVLVVEELEPVMEQELRAVAQTMGRTIPIQGKGVDRLSRLFEYDPSQVRSAIARYFGIPVQDRQAVDLSDIPPLPGRPPNLCPGCPHRSTFYAVKKVAGEEAIYPTDIGCYTLGMLPPLSAADFLICMGSSVSTASGFSRALDKHVIAFIGDSTFFHSGITGLVNAVHNNHKFTLIILDNETTAMTGHQPHPGVNMALLGLPNTQISIEAVVRGIGVKHLSVVQPRKVRQTMEAVQKALDFDGVSVIISKEICPLYAKRVAPPAKIRAFMINENRCKNHRDCVNLFACPAFYVEENQVKINENLCIGCAVCSQVCPENAIIPRK
ncbi:MAG: indolepyruvate ferredoxin oxidoreductase subunit alpha [Deltaproteobacteria bacterium RBG_13_43_22]|nr:MAG: indolepyruvate ferredoxin oxidoreductase subunit alpha [Deltaproteobacteria bacterium RBG_13_43_22]